MRQVRLTDVKVYATALLLFPDILYCEVFTGDLLSDQRTLIGEPRSHNRSQLLGPQELHQTIQAFLLAELVNRRLNFNLAFAAVS
jgi:hypothetical protein